MPNMPVTEEMQIIHLVQKDNIHDSDSGPHNVHRVVADLARAYILEEMRDDISAEDPRTVHDHPNDRTDVSAAEQVLPPDEVGVAAPAAVPRVDFAASPSEIHASSASVSQCATSWSPLPVNDDIVSRFQSILISATNDTESISELGTMIEARGVISSIRTELLGWTERGCCISPSSFGGEHACLSRFAEIEEMSLEDDDDEENEENYHGVEGSAVFSNEEEELNQNDSSVEDLGDLVVEDERALRVELVDEEETSGDTAGTANEDSIENGHRTDFVPDVHAEVIVVSSEKVPIETNQEGQDEMEAAESPEKSSRTIALQGIVQNGEAATSVEKNTCALDTIEEEYHVHFQDAIEMDCEEAQEEDDDTEFHDAVDREFHKASGHHDVAQPLHDSVETRATSVEVEVAATSNSQDVTDSDLIKQVEEIPSKKSGDIVKMEVRAVHTDLSLLKEEEVGSTKPEDTTATEISTSAGVKGANKRTSTTATDIVYTSEKEEAVKREAATASDICISSKKKVHPTTPMGDTTTGMCTSVDEEAAPTKPEDATVFEICISTEKHVDPITPNDATMKNIRRSVDEEAAPVKPEDATPTDIGMSVDEIVEPITPNDANVTDIGTSMEEEVAFANSEDAAATDIRASVDDTVDPISTKGATPTVICASPKGQVDPVTPQVLTATDVWTPAEEQVALISPEAFAVMNRCSSMEDEVIPTNPKGATSDTRKSTNKEMKQLHAQTESVTTVDEVTSISSPKNRAEIADTLKEKSATYVQCLSESDLVVSNDECDVNMTPDDTNLTLTLEEETTIVSAATTSTKVEVADSDDTSIILKVEEDHLQNRTQEVDEEEVGMLTSQNVIEKNDTANIELAVIDIADTESIVEKQVVSDSEGMTVESKVDLSLGPMCNLPQLISESNRISNKLQTPHLTDKKVHWLMSLDDLSSEGEMLSRNSMSSVGHARSKASSNQRTYNKATRVMESYNRVLAKDGCSGPLGEAVRSFLSKIRKDWEYIESRRIGELKADLISWTQSGACFTDSTSQIAQIESATFAIHPSGSSDLGIQFKEEERNVGKENIYVEDVSCKKRDAVPIESEDGNAADLSSNQIEVDIAARRSDENLPVDLDAMQGSFTDAVQKCGSSPVGGATQRFLSQVGSELTGEGPVVSSLKSEIISWAQSDYCGHRTSPQTKACVGNLGVGAQGSATECVPQDLHDFDIKSVQRCNKISLSATNNPTSGLSPIVVAPDSNTASITKGTHFTKTRLQTESNIPRENLQTEAPSEHSHNLVYKERDYLREWKLDAEEKMKCQDAVTGVLREKKLTLMKKYIELKREMKEFDKWKCDAEDAIKRQSAELETITSQKHALVKQCNEHRETIQHLTALKSAGEEAFATRDDALNQKRADNSTHSEECSIRLEAINVPSELKSQSTEPIKHQSSKLQSMQANDLTSQYNQYKKSIQELTLWKRDAGVAIESHRTALKQMEDKNVALKIQCSNQLKSIEDLMEWKREAEETIKKHLAKLDGQYEQNSDLKRQCREYKESLQELTLWKSVAEEKMAYQLKTLEELTRQNNDANALIKDQLIKLVSLQDLNSNLVSQCNVYQTSINALTAWKTDAEEKMESTCAELEQIKAEQAASLSNRDRQKVEELTDWKSNAEDTMKNNEAELKELRSDCLIFRNQCSDQQELIQEKDMEIQRLRKELEEASHKVLCLEGDTAVQCNKIKSYTETIESKSNEVNRLKVQIFKLNELNEHLTNIKTKPYEEEIISIKTAHHQELTLLKTENHHLTSKLKHLTGRDKEMASQVLILQGSIEDLKNKLEREKERHHESRTAVEQLEKTLKIAEKRRRKIEKKVISDKTFCDILSKQLDERH